MRLAFTIGSYRLLDFIRLGILQLQKLSPESPILVSDDRAHESDEINRIASHYGCAYTCPKSKRGHFAADFQSIVNSVAFAEANECDVAVKISQRLILRRPKSIEAIVNAFSDNDVCAATPGRPEHTTNTGTRGSFKAFSILSDIVMIRVGRITSLDLIQMYRDRIQSEHVPWKAFVECAIDQLHHTKFPGRTRKIEELTNPGPDPIFLRRYQATEKQYEELARDNGFIGRFPLVEWALIERQNYLANPIVV